MQTQSYGVTVDPAQNQALMKLAPFAAQALLRGSDIIKRVGIYGSVARGNAHRYSDLDMIAFVADEAKFMRLGLEYYSYANGWCTDENMRRVGLSPAEFASACRAMLPAPVSVIFLPIRASLNFWDEFSSVQKDQYFLENIKRDLKLFRRKRLWFGSEFVRARMHTVTMFEEDQVIVTE